MKNIIRILPCFFFLIGDLPAAQESHDVVMTVEGIEIPILNITPSEGKGPFPVVYNVHGGGWNGGTKTKETYFMQRDFREIYKVHPETRVASRFHEPAHRQPDNDRAGDQGAARLAIGAPGGVAFL